MTAFPFALPYRPIDLHAGSPNSAANTHDIDSNQGPQPSSSAESPVGMYYQFQYEGYTDYYADDFRSELSVDQCLVMSLELGMSAVLMFKLSLLCLCHVNCQPLPNLY